MSHRPRPHIRSGEESFRHRSVICDVNINESVAADAVSVDEISASGNQSTTSLTASRKKALKRLKLAASTVILTNNLKIDEDNDEARQRLQRAARSIVLLNRSSALLAASIRSIKEEKSKPATSHPRNAGKYTVIAFVNSASGGGMGKSIFKSLRDRLGPTFVFDLHSCRPGNMPEDSLLQYAYDPMVRVLACGGDGTCGWILSCLDKVWLKVLESEPDSDCQDSLLKYKDHLPLAIMPLGTGNDLSRQFGWGGSYRPHMQKNSMISAVQRSKLSSLDIWRCIIMPIEKLAEEEKQLIPEILGESYKSSESSLNSFKLLHTLIESDESPTTTSKSSEDTEITNTSVPINEAVYDGVLCNYLSLGFDATVAYRFHQEREAHPERFTSPLKNKLVYVMNTPYALTTPKLRSRVKMLVNDENGQLVPLNIPRSCRAIVSIQIRYSSLSLHVHVVTHPVKQ